MFARPTPAGIRWPDNEAMRRAAGVEISERSGSRVLSKKGPRSSGCGWTGPTRGWTVRQPRHPTSGSLRASTARPSSTSCCSRSPPTGTFDIEPLVVMRDSDGDDDGLIVLEGKPAARHPASATGTGLGEQGSRPPRAPASPSRRSTARSGRPSTRFPSISLRTGSGLGPSSASSTSTVRRNGMPTRRPGSRPTGTGRAGRMG